MKGDEVILIGAGGHAMSLAEFAGSQIRGYLSKEENPELKSEWLGDDTCAEALIESGHEFMMAFVYSGLPVMHGRKSLLEYYEKLGAHFASLISPSSIVTAGSKIGEGTAVMNGAIVNRALLGRHVVVNSGAIVEHDCRVGDNTFIGPGAVIGGFTEIGKNCFIGLGARIGNGLKIGDDITVGMGVTITKDLTDPGIYHGCPVRKWEKDKIGKNSED